jgi:hypothetical protein
MQRRARSGGEHLDTAAPGVTRMQFDRKSRAESDRQILAVEDVSGSRRNTKKSELPGRIVFDLFGRVFAVVGSTHGGH